MNTNMDIKQLFNFLQSSGNPQEFVYNMVEERMGNNPLAMNILNLAKQNKTGEIEGIARNLFKEQGRDFDKEFNSFRKILGL